MMQGVVLVATLLTLAIAVDMLVVIDAPLTSSCSGLDEGAMDALDGILSSLEHVTNDLTPRTFSLWSPDPNKPGASHMISDWVPYLTSCIVQQPLPPCQIKPNIASLIITLEHAVQWANTTRRHGVLHIIVISGLSLREERPSKLPKRRENLVIAKIDDVVNMLDPVETILNIIYNFTSC